MKYLDIKNIKEIGYDWEELTKVIEEAVICLQEGEIVQPIKSYLRFKNRNNRIISMPAYLGKDFDVAGIKWIASFPDNINKSIPRANSITLLNDSETGELLCAVNTSFISVLRTVSVARLMLKYYQKYRELKNPIIGIVGFGPIGQSHLNMISNFFENQNLEIRIYDLKGIDPSLIDEFPNAKVVSSWEEAYSNADIFITSTVSDQRYINLPPKDNSLHLNISLRDYNPELLKHFQGRIIVDSWEEICRENTDIEKMHQLYGLEKSGTYSLGEVIVRDIVKDIVNSGPIFFSPMGMSIFDVAMANHYYKLAVEKQLGTDL